MDVPRILDILSQPTPLVIEIPEHGITLRELTLQDVPLLFDLVDYDPDHLRQFGDDIAEKYASIEKIEASILTPENAAKTRFGIWVDDTLVGRINIEPIQTGVSAEVGYFVGKKYIGNNYAATALKALCDYAFTSLGYQVLEAHIAVGNEASRKAVEKCGFDLMTILRIEDKSGEERDYLIFRRNKL